MSTLKELMDSWPLPDGEPFPGETLRAAGWVYRDLPRMTPEAMEMFLGIVGEMECRWLTRARYPDGAVRGQLLISPQGMENMKEYSARNTSAGANASSLVFGIENLDGPSVSESPDGER